MSMPDYESHQTVTGPGRVALHDQIKADAMKTLKACDGSFVLIAQNPEDPTQARLCQVISIDNAEGLLEVCECFITVLHTVLREFIRHGCMALAALEEEDE
jgi:hypothetical protein